MSIDLSKVTALNDQYGNIAQLEMGGKVIWSAVSKVTWQKYSCTRTTGSTWKQVKPNVTTEETTTVTYSSGKITSYGSVLFSSTSGLGGSSSSYTTINKSVTATVLRTALRNRYFLVQETYEHRALKVSNAAITHASSQATIELTGTLSNIATKYTYNKGSTSYGTVQAEEGALPESGVLLQGSATGNYCVIRVGSTPYYYVKA